MKNTFVNMKFILPFFLMIFSSGAYASSEVNTCDEYIKMGEQVLKISASAHSSYKQQVSYNKCDSSQSNPHLADQFAMKRSFSVPGHSERLELRIIANLGIQPQDFLPLPENKYFKEKIKNIESLPREGSFYKYEFNQKMMKGSYIYISSHPSLRDFQGSPIKFMFGGGGMGAFSYGTSVQWKKDIFLTISADRNNLPKEESMEAWIPVFEELNKELEALEVN